MKVVFIHPDLGIGGAERLVLDLGLSLKRQGHSVHFLTAHHDPNHCFPETKDGSLPVTEVGASLPSNLFGIFNALCVYLRMIFIAFALTLRPKFSPLVNCDLIICDQVSACIPFLKLLYSCRSKRPKILFYGHFPDRCLTTRESLIKKIYRAPIDWFEGVTTSMADCILVNSHFTASIYRQTFKHFSEVKLDVLYPICNFSTLGPPVSAEPPTDLPPLPEQTKTLFLSLNRYERKKCHELSIDALVDLKGKLVDRPELCDSVHLIIAGGYDNLQIQNVEYHQELKRRADDLNVGNNVTFLKSPSDKVKSYLLHKCTALLYTPENEHFGIVPIEAMYCGRPVIACDSGGPLETVIDGETGFTCRPTSAHFSSAMLKFVLDADLSSKMGKAGREHVTKNFSSPDFDRKLSKIIDDLVVPESD